MEKINLVRTFVKEKNIGQHIFFFAMVLLFFLDYLTSAGFQMVFSGRLTQLIIILLGFKIVSTSYNMREWIILGVGAVLSILSFIHTDSYLVALFIMLIMAAKDVDFKKIMRLYIIEVTAIVVIVGMLAILGIHGSIFMERNFRGNGIEARYCMGFNHPNVYHIILIQLMLAYVWYLWDKIKWYHLIILLGLNGGGAFFTDSRTCLLVGSAALFACLIGKWIPQITDWIGIYILGCAVWAVGIVVPILTIIYGTGNAFLNKLNEVWTGRVFWAKYSFDTYVNERAISMFADTGFVKRCDMSFVNMTLLYGIVMTIVLMAVMLFVLIKSLVSREYVVLVIAVVGMLFFLGETFSSGEYVTRNILFVFMLGWNYCESVKPKK